MSGAAPKTDKISPTNQEILRDMVGEAILQFEAIAEEADRTIRRLRARLSSLETGKSEVRPD